MIDRAAHRAFTPYVVLRRRCRQSRIAGHFFEQPNKPDYPSSYANEVDEFIWFSTEETVNRVVSELSPL